MRNSVLTPDTTPGSGTWAAPDEPVEDYRAWLAERWREGTVKQYLIVAARQSRDEPFEPTGPYAAELRAAVDRIRGQSNGTAP